MSALLSRIVLVAVALSLGTVLLLGSLRAADSPPKITDETFQLKIVNETGSDILVRTVSFNRNWDPPVVKKGETFTAADQRHYFRSGPKVFVAYDLATKKIIVTKVVDINGPSVITFTTKDVTAGPLAGK
ncbi:MAG: hypothetical protein K2R98_18390 [Gemmataceae bacterium]|nr:hypothetical protein [Gemmataceae bacterium]